MISVDYVRQHEKLGPIIKEFPKFFTDEHDDYEQMTLALQILYEYQLGTESFWYPYINILPDVTFFCHWTPDQLAELDDRTLMIETEQYRNDVELEWK